MKYIIFFSIKLTIICSVVSFNLNATKSFLKENSLKECIILSCYNTNQNKEFFKSIQDDDIFLNVFDMTSNNNTLKLLKQLLYYRNYRIGVIFNFKCLKYQNNLFKIISIEKMFNFRYLWLFFSANLNGIKTIMAKYDINVDAEINLAVPQHDNRYN